MLRRGMPQDGTPWGEKGAAGAGGVRTARLFRLLVYCLVLGSSAGQFAVVPILPVYAHRFGLSGCQQGMVLGAIGLATLAVCLPAGALADRVGARKLTLAAGLLITVALGAQAAAGGFVTLLLSRLAFGVGFAVVWTAGLAWLAGASSGRSGLGGSVVSGGAGGVAGPAVAGVLVQYFGLAVPFFAAAAGFALITAALAAVRAPAGTPGPAAGVGSSVRAAASQRGTIAASAAIVTAGFTTGVGALLVPREMHAAGASPGQIGLVFSVAGVLFVVGSGVTAALGGRAVRLPVILAGMLALALALLPGAFTVASLALAAMLCATTAARSVLWTVSYPLAADGAERSSAGLGVVMGLLNAVWAATVLVGPLAAGAAAGHFSPQTVIRLTAALCLAVLAATALAVRQKRNAARQPGGIGWLPGGGARQPGSGQTRYRPLPRAGHSDRKREPWARRSA